MTISLIADLLMSVILIGAALLLWRFNERLGAFRAAQSDMRDAASAFDAAALRAEENLRRIEAAGRLRHLEYERAMRRVGELATELSVMAASGDRTAERLEQLIAAARNAAAALSASRASEPASTNETSAEDRAA